MNKLFLTATAFAVATTASPAMAQVSADFETGYGSFTPSGNVYRANGATYAGCCGTSPADLNYFVAFGGGNAASGIISAPFATFLGRLYTVAFDYGALGGGSETLSVTVGGLTNTYNPIASANPITYTHASFSFLGNGSPTALSFTSSGLNNVDAIVDNVLVTSVPEPASGALMILGFGVAGTLVRRRAQGRTAVSFG